MVLGDKRGFTPLMLAAFHGLDTIAVDKVWKIPDFSAGKSVDIVCTVQRNVSLVKDLVGEFKADVDYTNEVRQQMKSGKTSTVAHMWNTVFVSLAGTRHPW